MEKPKFEFEVDFKTRKAIMEPIGRLVLGDGSCVRMVFTPDGLKIALDKNSTHIIFLDNSVVYYVGLDPQENQGAKE